MKSPVDYCITRFGELLGSLGKICFSMKWLNRYYFSVTTHPFEYFSLGELRILSLRNLPCFWGEASVLWVRLPRAQRVGGNLPVPRLLNRFSIHN
jgi:hypothetical protein